MALRKFAFNVAALSVARALQTIASVAAIPLLARLLEPSEFGLLALAMPFVLFGMAVGDAGLGQSLVRVKQSEALVWSSAFWLIVGICAGLSAFILAMAFPISWAFEQPAVASVIAVLASVPLLQGFTTLPIADLQQREKFRTLAAVEVASSFAALLSAVLLALGGAGVWALVSQATLYWVVKAGLLALASPFRPSFRFEWSALEGHFTFSRDSAIGNLVSFFSRQIDPLVIGKLLGAAPLGLYTMANRIVVLPQQLLAGPAQNALYVKMVALRHNRGALRDIVMISSLAVAILVFPPLLIASAASNAFFHAFLSAKWGEGAAIFAVLAPVAAIQSISTLWVPMLLALEQTTLRLRIGIELTVLWLIVLPFAAMHSVLAVAIAYAIVYCGYSFTRAFAAYLSPIGVKVREMAAELAAPIFVSVGAAIAHIILVRVFHVGTWVEVALALAEMAAALGLLVAICWRRLRANVGQLRALFAGGASLSEEGAQGVAD